MKRTLCITGALALAAGTATADDYFFIEHDFDPQTWSTIDNFWVYAPSNGETASVTSDRFTGGNPPNSFMVQQFFMDVPQPTFNVVFAPVMMEGWTYDPSSQGAITQFAASMTTIPVAENQHDHLAAVRMYLMQDDTLFVAHIGGNFYEAVFDGPAEVHNFSGYTQELFYELTPEGGLDEDSHPDFAGGEMQFGFGLSLTTTHLDGAGPLTMVGAFDDVSVRFSTVPTPGGLALLGAGGVAAIRRRR